MGATSSPSWTRGTFGPLERKTKAIVHQWAKALLHCHKNGISHRDVKLDNCLIDKEGKTKLIDFGLASMDEKGEGSCLNFVGSPEYVAPEIIRSKPYSGTKADVYSLGVSLYCLLFGQYPFFPEQRFELLRAGKEHPPIEWPDSSPLFLRSVGASAKNLISKMFEPDPEKRISMEEVVNDRWFEEKTQKSVPLGSLGSLREINVC